MRRWRMLPALACLVSSTSLAQEPATTAPPESVLAHVPADCMGYIVVPRIERTVRDIENYLGTIGLGEMITAQFPEGLLAAIRTNANLGDGFNPAGGFAVVLLDPSQFGIDLAERMAGGGTETDEPLPVVVLVPGKSVEEVFGLHQITRDPQAEHGYPCIDGDTYAAQAGDYLALAPSPAILAGFQAQTCPAASVLSEDDKAFIAHGAVALQINMAVAGPVLDSILAEIQQQAETMQQMVNEGQMPSPQGPGAAIMGIGPVLPLYRDILSQVSSATAVGRFAETGLVIEKLVDFKPESDIGKMVAAFQPTPGPLLDKLPDLPYVLAVGGGGATTLADEDAESFSQRMMDLMISLPFYAEMDQAALQNFTDAVRKLDKQITGFQMVLGGAPAGSGVFGVAYVLQGPDAQAIKTSLTELVPLYETFIKSMPQVGPEIQELTLTYTEAAETLGERPVDVIDISLPKVETMDEAAKAKMVSVLGEDRLRIRIAAADDQTVVVTFGGADKFLAEALETAATGGTIAADEATAEALGHLPEGSAMVALLNVGNLFETIERGMQATLGEEAALPFAITSRTPIAVGVGLDGSRLHGALYLPNDLMSEGVGLVQMFMTGGMGPAGPQTMPQEPAQPPAAEEEF